MLYTSRGWGIGLDEIHHKYVHPHQNTLHSFLPENSLYRLIDDEQHV